ncbi:MAG: DUF2510 domain-containing protein, partial [Promicromonosporaceae bacterium]|nr:DUF2510 domain-containing protein [Promicromonosporaceae bacterium]
MQPANWYPDPATPGQERWWDGQAWTEHVRLAAAAPVPAQVMSAPGVSAPASLTPPEPEKQPGRGGVIAVVMAAVVALAAVIFGVVFLLG